MEREEKLEGGCLCKAVRFSAIPRSKRFSACHCDMCRHWTSGAYLYIGCANSLEILDEASLGIYSSSKLAERHFCTKCGTSLWYKRKGSNDHFISIELFDDTSGFEFVGQIYIDEKPDYYTFCNETRNLTGAETRNMTSNEIKAAFAPSNFGGANV